VVASACNIAVYRLFAETKKSSIPPKEAVGLLPLRFAGIDGIGSSWSARMGEYSDIDVL
jgi:hypothetical protein